MDLFPIPLFITSIPPNLSSIVPFFNQQKMGGNEGANNIYGIKSLNSYILNEPECLELSQFIISQTKIYSNQILNYNYPSYKFTQSWLSYKRPKESHIQHSHPNSIISGVLYYGEYSKLSPSIVFHKNTSFPSNTNSIQIKYKSTDSPSPYSSENIFYNPNPGDLILFPSYLQHSVPTNTSDKIRKSLAFNIVPTEGLGDEESLTELKFN